MPDFTNTSAPSVEQVTPAGPLHERIVDRWSPYGFAEYPVQNDELESLLEGARWAASSYDGQLWTYLVANRSAPEEFEQLLSCLVPENQQWAKAAPVLVLSIVRRRPSKISPDDLAAVHELGMSSAHLAREATARGLSIHQVLGIFADRARDLYGIPEDFEAWAAMAIGYDERTEKLPETTRPRDRAPRAQKPARRFAARGSRALRTAAMAG
ncbi:MAG: nitroreductase family protein [Opitutaceae bacterium]|nr:nitroreductase family protein [Opitutaceae bacterium]